MCLLPGVKIKRGTCIKLERAINVGVYLLALGTEAAIMTRFYLYTEDTESLDFIV
jgi:hypothetical protein